MNFGHVRNPNYKIFVTRREIHEHVTKQFMKIWLQEYQSTKIGHQGTKFWPFFRNPNIQTQFSKNWLQGDQIGTYIWMHFTNFLLIFFYKGQSADCLQFIFTFQNVQFTKFGYTRSQKIGWKSNSRNLAIPRAKCQIHENWLYQEQK